jgi:hypothetical protein
LCDEPEEIWCLRIGILKEFRGKCGFLFRRKDKGRRFLRIFVLKIGMRARGFTAHVAQLVERILGKDEVSGSTPLMGSITEEEIDL